MPSSHLVVAFFSCSQSFPASGSFPVSWLFTSGGHNIEDSASASALTVNIQGWFPLGLTGLISLLYKGLSRVFSATTVWKHQVFGARPSLWCSCHVHIFGGVVHPLNRVQLLATPGTAACQASLSFTVSWSFLKLMSIESVTPSNHLVLCHPFLLLPSIFPSIRVFSSELALRIKWPRYWSFSFSPSNEYSGFIYIRIDWFDLLAFQGSLWVQHHSSKVSILWCSAFFMVQLSHPHMTTGKTIALTIRTFVGKVMSLLFNVSAFHSCYMIYWYKPLYEGSPCYSFLVFTGFKVRVRQPGIYKQGSMGKCHRVNFYQKKNVMATQTQNRGNLS